MTDPGGKTNIPGFKAERALFNRSASCMSPSLNWGQIIMNKGKYKFLQKLLGCVARKGYLFQASGK